MARLCLDELCSNIFIVSLFLLCFRLPPAQPKSLLRLFLSSPFLVHEHFLKFKKNYSDVEFLSVDVAVSIRKCFFLMLSGIFSSGEGIMLKCGMLALNTSAPVESAPRISSCHLARVKIKFVARIVRQAGRRTER